MSDQLTKVKHDLIRYANCWEDADLLIEALQIQEGDNVLSIGSAGDNSFSLLINNPKQVVAVDINPVQLNLIELKKAAIKALDHHSFLAFLGFNGCPFRWDLFQQVKTYLSPDLITFWENRKTEIIDGIIRQGKFENYFRLFRNRILPLIHSKKTIDRLFQPKNENEQQAFYEKTWNTWRWRLLFKVFFSKWMMGRLGRDPEFLKEVNISVSNFILNQATKKLSSPACQNNYFLAFILKGHFGSTLPHYARKENFKTIKSNIDQLTVFNGLAEDAFKQYQGFNKFNLSNIFEYMSPRLFKLVSQNLIENGQLGSRYAYWNLMVPRRISSITSDLKYEKTLSEQLKTKDKGFFYSNFIIDIKK